MNAQGYRLTGYPAGAIGANPVELQLPMANVAPKATATATTANLDANAKVIYTVDTTTDPGAPGRVDLGGTVYSFRRDTNGDAVFDIAPTPIDGTYPNAAGTGNITITGGRTAEDLTVMPSYQAYEAPRSNWPSRSIRPSPAATPTRRP